MDNEIKKALWATADKLPEKPDYSKNRGHRQGKSSGNLIARNRAPYDTESNGHSLSDGIAGTKIEATTGEADAGPTLNTLTGLSLFS